MHVAMTISLMLLDLLGLLNLLGLLGLLNLFQERVGQGPCDSPFHGLSGLSGRFGLLGLLGFLGLLPSSMVVVVSMVVRFTTTGSETKVQGNT
jgi:hypothetical protein